MGAIVNPRTSDENTARTEVYQKTQAQRLQYLQRCADDADAAVASARAQRAGLEDQMMEELSTQVAALIQPATVDEPFYLSQHPEAVQAAHDAMVKVARLWRRERIARDLAVSAAQVDLRIAEGKLGKAWQAIPAPSRVASQQSLLEAPTTAIKLAASV